MKGHIREKFKNYLIEILAIDLLISITIFFFGPLENIMSKSTEFWFGVLDVLPIILKSTLLCFVAIFLLLFISTFYDKLYKVFCGLLFSIGVAFYLQGNWMFVSYGILDGTPINWNSFKLWSIVNTCIWVVILVIGMFLCIKFVKCSTFISYVIVGIQIMTLLTLVFTAPSENESSELLVTRHNQFKLSENNQNVLVIIADGFDGCDFLPILEEEPDFVSFFDGFTFYENTCGVSLWSGDSVFSILTGNQYSKGVPLDENRDQICSESKIFKTLNDNNYRVDLYFQTPGMLSNDIIPLIDNISVGKTSISDNWNAWKKIYKMVMFRYAPHILKPQFWYTTMDFDELKDGSYEWYNTDFYQRLKNGELSAKRTNENVYQFFWLQGPHPPIVMDSECNPIGEIGEDEFAQAQNEQQKGVVRIFTQLITSLKNEKIYDNTSIVFLADHGWDKRYNPLLLLKPANAHGDLTISRVPVSMIEDWEDTLVYLLDGKDKQNTIFNLDENTQRVRPYYLYYPDGEGKTYVERETVPFRNDDLSLSYQLGDFISPQKFAMLSLKGISYPEKNFVRADGKEVEFVFKDIDYNGDLYFSMEVESSKASVSVLANEKKVADFVIEGTSINEIYIPPNTVEDERLSIKLLLSKENAMNIESIDDNSFPTFLLKGGVLDKNTNTYCDIDKN